MIATTVLTVYSAGMLCHGVFWLYGGLGRAAERKSTERNATDWRTPCRKFLATPLRVCVCVCGHIVRMPDFRIPKQAFFGQLASGCRLQGGPVRRYKDSLKINLRACNLAPSVLRTAPLDRSVWRQCCSNAISAFEERRTAALVAKQKARKDPVATRRKMMWTCDVCGKPCASRIGLFAHRKSHRWSGDPSTSSTTQLYHTKFSWLLIGEAIWYPLK